MPSVVIEESWANATKTARRDCEFETVDFIGFSI